MRHNIVARKIMWGDLDALNIVFYPRYYEWFDACGHLFFEAAGIPIQPLWHQRHILFGLVESGCRYARPGRYYQDVQIVTRVSDLDTKIVVLGHTIRDAGDHTTLAEGFEKRICMDVADPQAIRAIDMPADIHARLKATTRTRDGL